MAAGAAGQLQKVVRLLRPVKARLSGDALGVVPNLVHQERERDSLMPSVFASP